MNTKTITFALGLAALLSGCASMENGEFATALAVFGQSYGCSQGNQAYCPAAQRQEAAPVLSVLPVLPPPPVTTYCYTRGGVTTCQSH